MTTDTRLRMKTVEHPQTSGGVSVAMKDNSRQPSKAYSSITEPVNVGKRSVRKPFAQHVYERRLSSKIQTVGFPRATGDTVKPWIPGVTTPEGIILATGIAVVAMSSPDMVERLATVAATMVVAGVSLGVPSAALVMSLH